MNKDLKKHIILRRIIVIYSSMVVLLITALTIIPRTFLNYIAYKIAYELNILIPPGKPGQNINITYDNTNTFFKLSFIAIGLTISLSIVLFFWDKLVSNWKIKFVTILFMVILMIVSTINYSYHDQLWRLELQTLLDYVNAFWGLVILQYLLKLKIDSEHLKAVSWITFFLVCMFGTLLPFLFGTLYILHKVGISTVNFNDKWVTVPASVISLIISWLSYKQKSETNGKTSV